MKVDVSVIYFRDFPPITCNLCNKYFSHYTLHQLSNCFTVEVSWHTFGLPGEISDAEAKHSVSASPKPQGLLTFAVRAI